MTHPIDDKIFVARGTELRSFAKEVIVAAPPETLFAAWTTAEGWAQIYGPPSVGRFELAIGGRYEWLFDGEIGSNACQVLSFVPNRLLSFSWNAPPIQPQSRALRTWVVVELEPADDESTRLRLTHLGFGDGPQWDETYAYFDAAWESVLARMVDVFGSSSNAAGSAE